MIYEVTGNEIKFEHGKLQVFETTIANCVDVNGLLVLILAPAQRNGHNDVVALHEDGELAWRISGADFPNPATYFVGVPSWDTDIIRVSAYTGDVFDLERRTGTVLGSAFRK